jgi:hypothetical protein
MCFKHITKDGQRWLSSEVACEEASVGHMCGEYVSRGCQLRCGKGSMRKAAKGKKSKICAARKKKDNDAPVIFVNHNCKLCG